MPNNATLPINWQPSYSINGATAATGWNRSRIYLLLQANILETYQMGGRRFIVGESLAQAYERARRGGLDVSTAELENQARQVAALRRSA